VNANAWQGEKARFYDTLRSDIRVCVFASCAESSENLGEACAPGDLMPSDLAFRNSSLYPKLSMDA